MPVKVRFEEPMEESPKPVTPTPEPTGIDLPGVDGVAEKSVKKVLIKIIDKAIEIELGWKAKLRAPVKAADMPEIEEEDAQ